MSLALTLMLLVCPLNAFAQGDLTGGLTSAQDFKWVGMDADKIGQWDNGNPDKTLDGHFVLNFNLPAPTEIKSIQVYNADANGNPVNGQVWDTADSNYWILGVFDHDTQLNLHHVPTLGTFSAPVQLDLYCDDSGWFKPGNWFGLKVTFGDGTKLERLISIPSGPQPPTNFAQWSEDAINWGERHLNLYDWWDSAKQQGYCLQFVSNAFMQEEVEGASGYNTAIEAANGLYRFDQGPGGWQYAPRGAIIFFDKKGKNEDGHVGIYLGDGRILNAYGKVQEFTIDKAMTEPDIGQYIGWSYPPESWRPASETSQNTMAPGASNTGIQQPTSHVTLTLYVHDGDTNGPVISGAQVTGQDGSENSFQQTTDNNGYVTIDGTQGTWSFTASAPGYETNGWSQSITLTCTKHAFLQKTMTTTPRSFDVINSAIWTVSETGPMGNCPGTWIRRPGTNTFDASWSCEGGVTDIIDITSIEGNKITLHRRGINGDYTGTISPDGKSISGTGSWFNAGQKWLVSVPT